MIPERDARAIRAWLDDEPPVLPTHVWYAVLSEIPTVRQRRWRLPLDRLGPVRPAARVAAVAALLLVVAAGLVLVAGALGLWRTAAVPRPFPTGEVPIPAGRYVIDAPFPVRVSVDIPDGWSASELGPTWAAMARDRPSGPAIVITRVDRLYADPCRPDLGLADDPGPAAADLAAALAALPGLEAGAPRAGTIGGRGAWEVSVQAPPIDPGCTGHPDEPAFVMWGLPDTAGLEPGDRADIRAVVVDGQRLVIVVFLAPSSTDADEMAAAAVVHSLRFGDEAATVPPGAVEPITPPEGPTDPPMEPLRIGRPLAGGPTMGSIQLYTTGPDGGPMPLPFRHDLALDVPRGWFGTAHGVAAGPADRHSASVGAWAIRAIHPDPCRWRTSLLEVSPDRLDDLVASLAGGWSRSTDAHAPVATRATNPPWLGRPAYLLELAVPRELDLAGCDGGEARLWEGHDGASRLVQPGERLRLRVTDLQPGLVVLAVASGPDASLALLETTMAAGASVWIAPPPSPGPASGSQAGT